MTCYVSPSFPSFPEPLVRLICPEHEEDGQETTDELVRPLGHLEDLVHVPVVGGKGEEEGDEDRPEADEAKTVGDPAEKKRSTGRH